LLLSKLKVLGAVALAVTVAAAGTVSYARRALADKPAAAAKEEAPKDEEKIAGAWAIESAERGGQKVPAELFKEGKWIFAGDGKVTAKFRGENGPALRGTYKLDPATKPKQITITTDDGKTQPSIYKLDGDTLTLCLGDKDLGTERPTEFASKEGSKVILFVLKREKK
jgi:uncharacterized protein (TIGR03067 family)